MDFSKRACQRACLVLLFARFAGGAFGQSVIYNKQTDVAGYLAVFYANSCRDSEGNFYITGEVAVGVPTQSGQNGPQIVTQKITPEGVVVWTNLFQSAPIAVCSPNAIAVDAKGEVFLYGSDFNPYTPGTYTLVHISSGGSTLWSHVGPPRISAVGVNHVSKNSGLALDASGNPIIVAINDGWKGFNLVKYNAVTGSVIYNQPSGFGDSCQCQTLLSDSSGRLFATVDASVGTVVTRYDESTGKQIWQRVLTAYGKALYVGDFATLLLHSGDVVVGSKSSDQNGTFTFVMFDRVKASDGSFVYRKSLGTQVSGAQMSPNGQISTDSKDQLYWSVDERSPQNQTMQGKSDSAGNVIWSKVEPISYPGVSEYQVCASNDGGMYRIYEGNSSKIIDKLDSSGHTLWAKTAMAGYGIDGYDELYFDDATNLTCLCPAIDSNYNSFFGLFTLASGDGSVDLSRKESPVGRIDNRIGAIYDGSVYAAHDSAGNTYVTGTQGPFIYAAMFDPSGKGVWRTFIGSILNFEPTNITYSDTGCLVIACDGWACSLTAKLKASTGSLLWESSPHRTGYQMYRVGSVKVDAFGTVDVGFHVSDNPGNEAFMVEQYRSSSGSVNWSYSKATTSTNGQIAMDPSGDVYLAGYHWSGTVSEFNLVKISPSGKVLFDVLEPTNNGAQTYADGDISAVGIQLDPATKNIFLISSIGNLAPNQYQIGCYSSSGMKVWSENLDLGSDRAPSTIHSFVGKSGSLYLVAATSASYNVAIVDKFEGTSGKLLFSSATPTSLPFALAGAALDASDNILLCGNSATQIVADKMDGATGKMRWSTTYNDPYGSALTQTTGVTVGTDGNPIVVGYTLSPLGVVDSLLLKLLG